MTRRLHLASLALAFVAIACRSSPEPTQSNDDAAADDAADALPPLDPRACGSVDGAESADFDPAFVAKTSGDRLKDKAFPLLSALSADASIAATLRADATLSAIATARAKQLDDATTCTDAACMATAVAWSAADAERAANALVSALGDGAAPFVKSALRPSGAFARWSSLDDVSLLRTAFGFEISSAASAVATFAPELDASGRSKAIDAARARPSPLFFDPTLSLALSVLATDGRDEAIRHDPLDTGENAAALAAIPHIDFAAYPFPLLVVPGEGPTKLDEPLSGGSQLRADLAADRWFARVAPLVALTGGHVHPDRTPYAEALEVKKYLVTTRGLPASAILVDPYARHTTTNLRNVARLVFRHRLPADRASLIVSDPFQSAYVIDNPFALRCDAELSLRPFRKIVALSINDSCFFPSKLSLQIDARDPLDP